MARASLVRSSLAWLHVFSSGPLYSLRSLELPATTVGEWRRRHSLRRTQGRTRAAAFNRVSFKPERVF